jgi:NUDIX domain
MAYIRPSSRRRQRQWPMSEASHSWFQQPLNKFISVINDFMPLPARTKAPTAARSRPTTSTEQSSGPQVAPRRTVSPEPLSEYSTPAVPNSAWCSQNFMLGAGMVIIQPSTDKFVIVHDSIDGQWFLPRGRKDLGESLEKTALREAYEEVRGLDFFLFVYV